MTPFFSVVTPSWNQGTWLSGNIASVLAQGAPDFEHIVCDNCSTDSTPAVLAAHPHVRAVVEHDSGQANALNKGFRLARGEIICWLNADDQYLPGVFEIVRREMAKPGVDVVYGDAIEDWCDGQPPRVRKARFARREDLLRWWTKRVDVLQPAVFFRHAAFAEVGWLREDLYMVMDQEFWWRLAARHPFHYLGVSLALQQRQSESKTVSQVARIYEEKEKVFDPLLHAAEPHRRIRNIVARRVGMGRRWLGLAQSAAKTDAKIARDFLARARRSNPLLALSPRWWAARVCS